MEWRDIPGYDGEYQASDTGLIRSYKNGHYHQMALKLNKKQGYYYVILYMRNKAATRTVHRLVASAFIPNPDNLPQVNHIDEDKTNNNVANLEWCTAKHNNEHSKHRRYKPVNVYEPDGELLATFTSERALAQFLGVSKGAVCSTLKGDHSSCCGFVLEYAKEAS